jgi:hypothetical protein
MDDLDHDVRATILSICDSHHKMMGQWVRMGLRPERLRDAFIWSLLDRARQLPYPDQARPEIAFHKGALDKWIWMYREGFIQVGPEIGDCRGSPGIAGV